MIPLVPCNAVAAIGRPVRKRVKQRGRRGYIHSPTEPPTKQRPVMANDGRGHGKKSITKGALAQRFSARGTSYIDNVYIPSEE